MIFLAKHPSSYCITRCTLAFSVLHCHTFIFHPGSHVWVHSNMCKYNMILIYIGLYVNVRAHTQAHSTLYDLFVVFVV